MKAGAQTPATGGVNVVFAGLAVRSTKAGTETPATGYDRNEAPILDVRRSTKAGA